MNTVLDETFEARGMELRLQVLTQIR
jgi:hypothetical protein